ncbi:MAG: protein translocase subunit SecD [Candidatus Marinimicrobia bacterium]|nr:protein translocase subunit SecD [bacterium]MCG2717166.1 protein translocase subunit SecD [Candidatus Neomarinimicrobiota bacterium]
MFKKTNIRFIIIGMAILLATYSLYWTVAYNSFSPEKLEIMRSDGTNENYENRIIRLGLDLQGGMHVVLELNLPKLTETLATNKTPEFYTILNNTTDEYKATNEDFFNIFLRNVESEDFKLIRHFPNMEKFKNDGIVAELRSESKDAMQRALQIIRNRVDQFGVSEPTIQKAGQYRIIVELAGIKDPERARDLIQSTALLEFTLLKDPQVTQSFIASVDNYLKTGRKDAIQPVSTEEDTTVAIKESKDKAVSVNELLGITEADMDIEGDTTDSALVVDAELFADKPFSSLLRNVHNSIGVPERNLYTVKKILSDPDVEKLLPYDSQFLWSAKPERITSSGGKTENYFLLYHLNREAGIQGKYIKKATASIGGAQTKSAGQPIININMNSEGARIFSRLTGSNIGKFLAIVLDDKVYMAPSINVKIPNGSAYIEGLENMEEAKNIAIILRAGALPAPVDVIEERTIGPSLGRDSINIGTKVGLIGFLLVIGFMVLYYKQSGLLADLALVLNIVFVMAILATLGATLTLPGIAGLILTVGIAVDANVLIFERIREELERGKTVRAAIDAGYSRAFRTILDANVTTMLTALILWQFGTGPVKGFAVTLFWGILSSMFTAIFVTRTFYNYRTDRKVLKTLSI